jgi:hypothetical protein
MSDCIFNLPTILIDVSLFLIMSIKLTDILTSTPLREDIHEGVIYAVKSIPHTYDRMEKETWKRAARIARGKVNEQIVHRDLLAMGIEVMTVIKDHREIDFNDYVLNPEGKAVQTDLKTFHVIEGLVKPPRQLFDLGSLLSSGDHTGPWQNFYPMLVPAEYRKPKDLFIFGVSVEPRIPRSTPPLLEFSWRAFPETEAELFLIDKDQVAERKNKGKLLSVTVTWPESVRPRAGRLSIGFEEGKKVSKKQEETFGYKIELASQRFVQCQNLASFICIGLDEAAYKALGSSGKSVNLEVFDQSTSKNILSSMFNAGCFKEIFPRKEYRLSLVGWITLEEFRSRSALMPATTPCYFYPPERGGTKTKNRYVLPQTLNPINTLFGETR